VSLAELGRFAEAANALETAVFHSPDRGEAWGRLGQARTELGRYHEAVDAFERAVELGFAPSGLWVDLGRSAAEVRDLRALGRAYEELRDERPHEAELIKRRLVALRRRRRSGRRERHGGRATGPVQRTLAGLGMSAHPGAVPTSGRRERRQVQAAPKRSSSSL
jgi:tetratricopeptide (TPR) repeat protein